MSESKAIWTVVGAMLGFALSIWVGTSLWPSPPLSAAFAIGFGAAWIGAGFGALIGMSDRG